MWRRNQNQYLIPIDLLSLLLGPFVSSTSRFHISSLDKITGSKAFYLPPPSGGVKNQNNLTVCLYCRPSPPTVTLLLVTHSASAVTQKKTLSCFLNFLRFFFIFTNSTIISKIFGKRFVTKIMTELLEIDGSVLEGVNIEFSFFHNLYPLVKDILKRRYYFTILGWTNPQELDLTKCYHGDTNKSNENTCRPQQTRSCRSTSQRLDQPRYLRISRSRGNIVIHIFLCVIPRIQLPAYKVSSQSIS